MTRRRRVRDRKRQNRERRKRPQLVRWAESYVEVFGYSESFDVAPGVNVKDWSLVQRQGTIIGLPPATWRLTNP